MIDQRLAFPPPPAHPKPPYLETPPKAPPSPPPPLPGPPLQALRSPLGPPAND